MSFVIYHSPLTMEELDHAEHIIHHIDYLRYKMESSMHQVFLLTDRRSMIFHRLQRASKCGSSSCAYLAELQLTTTNSVVKMFQHYLMTTWKALEDMEDRLINIGLTEDEVEVLIWGHFDF